MAKLNDVKLLIDEVDKNRTFADKIKVARKLKKEHKKDELVVKAVDHYLDSIRVYVVDLLERIKESDNDAWEEFSDLPDIRNFIHYYTHSIGEFYKFRYSMDIILHEVRWQMFYHIKKNYRPYNDTDEISLLIHSMRSWIKFKVGKAISQVYKPKNPEEEFLPNTEIIDDSHDESKFETLEIAKSLLDDECYQVLCYKVLDEFSLIKIGELMGFSDDTAKRRYEKAIKTIKNYYEHN
ncbi:RNA polymerase sigma factor [Bacillus phage BCPST]|uniref:RNA polymerase sigma factor n=1 Tax=Bacillus phage BCPST TaxID=2801506 RepID=A0AAE7TQQ2_9CAUD|nr:RNA polymerase sigma factor [Bacillus phage BCPST]QQO38714.1 RNA polymerase sigma factor [Bacillus phage BCPST]QSJ04303.1 hypothetical protein BCP6_099 [Bacillus phage BCP6]